MARKNKLEKIDYKESSINIADSHLISFNLPSYWNFTKNGVAIPIPSWKRYIIMLFHNFTTNFYMWIWILCNVESDIQFDNSTHVS